MPWADTFNHESSPTTRWSYISESNRKGWYLKTEKTIEAGSEIFDTYNRKKTNSELLNQYGFVVENNPNPFSLTVTLNLDTADPLYKKKAAHIGKSKKFSVRSSDSSEL